MTDPFDSDLIESVTEFQDRMNQEEAKYAAEMVDMYKSFIKEPSRSERWWPRVLYVIMALFLVLAVMDIMLGNYWLVPLHVGLAALQLLNLKTHRRTKARRESSNAEWREKMAAAENVLRDLDPTNVRVSEIINEEP